MTGRAHCQRQVAFFFLVGHNFNISEDSSNIEYSESAVKVCSGRKSLSSFFQLRLTFLLQLDLCLVTRSLKVADFLYLGGQPAQTFLVVDLASEPARMNMNDYCFLKLLQKLCPMCVSGIFSPRGKY